MGLSSKVSVDAESGPGGKPQRPGPTLGPHHNIIMVHYWREVWILEGGEMMMRFRC